MPPPPEYSTIQYYYSYPFPGNGIVIFKLMSFLFPMMFLSLDHDFIGKLMKLLLLAFTISSMTYELAISGRNCFPQAAKLFTQREVRLMPSNETVWFPQYLNSTGSSLLIMILQILFVICSLAITIKSNKKIISKKFKQLLGRRRNAVNPLPLTNMTDNQNKIMTTTNVREHKDDLEKGSTNQLIQPTTSKQVLNSVMVTHLSENNQPLSSSSLTVIEVADKTESDSANLGIHQHKQVTLKEIKLHVKINKTLRTKSGFKPEKGTNLQKTQNHYEKKADKVENAVTVQKLHVGLTYTTEVPKVQQMVFKMASSTSAIIIYNFIILQFIFSLKDYPYALRFGYSYFKAVFDTIPLLVILTKGPIYDLVKRRVASFNQNSK